MGSELKSAQSMNVASIGLLPEALEKVRSQAAK